MNLIDIINLVTWRPRAPRHKGYCQTEGGILGIVLPHLGRSGLPLSFLSVF